MTPNDPTPIRFTDEDEKLIEKLRKRLGITTPAVLRLALRALTQQEAANAPRTIEVYEWAEGAPRPGTTRKARETCIDTLEIPSGGQVPQTGDIILISEPGGDPFVPGRYRVIERELLWWRNPDDNSQTGQRWTKLWIHVRRVKDETK